MLNEIKYGTFLLFGFCCLFMALWAYVCLPETTGYALEDIGLLFEKDVILRAVGDAPGGRFFLGRRRAEPIDKLRRDGDSDSEKGRDGEEKVGIENVERKDSEGSAEVEPI
jgi:hypothetical protein